MAGAERSHPNSNKLNLSVCVVLHWLFLLFFFAELH